MIAGLFDEIMRTVGKMIAGAAWGIGFTIAVWLLTWGALELAALSRILSASEQSTTSTPSPNGSFPTPGATGGYSCPDEIFLCGKKITLRFVGG